MYVYIATVLQQESFGCFCFECDAMNELTFFVLGLNTVRVLLLFCRDTIR